MAKSVANMSKVSQERIQKKNIELHFLSLSEKNRTSLEEKLQLKQASWFP